MNTKPRFELTVTYQVDEDETNTISQTYTEAWNVKYEAKREADFANTEQVSIISLEDNKTVFQANGAFSWV